MGTLPTRPASRAREPGRFTCSARHRLRRSPLSPCTYVRHRPQIPLHYSETLRVLPRVDDARVPEPSAPARNNRPLTEVDATRASRYEPITRGIEHRRVTVAPQRNHGIHAPVSGTRSSTSGSVSPAPHTARPRSERTRLRPRHARPRPGHRSPPSPTPRASAPDARHCPLARAAHRAAPIARLPRCHRPAPCAPMRARLRPSAAGPSRSLTHPRGRHQDPTHTTTPIGHTGASKR